MDIGIGLDATLNLSFADQAALSQEAARLGYTNIWTPENTGQDAFQLCSQRWAASCQVVPERTDHWYWGLTRVVPHSNCLCHERWHRQPTDRGPFHHGDWCWRYVPS